MNSSVVAVCDIPEGACSLPGVGDIDIKKLLEKSTTKSYFHVELHDGYLSVIENQIAQNWANYIAIAKNCHEQNVELTKSPTGLILRMTRSVKASEELYVWIGVDLISKLEFPFLTPMNIKGNQAYHCHKCGKIFQNPNPLKVHLSFQCKTSKPEFSEHHNSFRVINCISDNGFKRTFEKSVKPLEISKSYGISNFKVSDSNNSPLPLLLYPNAYPTVSGIPPYFGKSDSRTLQVLNSVTVPEHTNSLRNDVAFEFRLSQEPTRSLAPSSANMWLNPSSNYFTSSSGHVCSYCGKVYSRKYGLKIHVRTHTGYKPLKCKYCFRPFSDPSNLNKHVRLHSESDTPYRCTICGKVLVRRRDLQRHIKSRHPDESLDHIKKQTDLHSDDKTLEKL
ncbi:PR domain zinc finger protein 13 [Caerostris darwini]|uniref:PR domain zinc finger protein 13 n=1 Tax=Caerostris darwini TaxID=1538125 RepID=A0AAV4UA14_9ARAC|nr:PR domain zinc finger protein 13 [Caerostris darwini]